MMIYMIISGIAMTIFEEEVEQSKSVNSYEIDKGAESVGKHF